MPSAIRPRPVAAGAEEEFHIVDLATRGLTGQADRLMGVLPADRFSWEMQRSVLELVSWTFSERIGFSGTGRTARFSVSLGRCSRTTVHGWRS
jgi:hypothetical protein